MNEIYFLTAFSRNREKAKPLKNKFQLIKRPLFILGIFLSLPAFLLTASRQPCLGTDEQAVETLEVNKI